MSLGVEEFKRLFQQMDATSANDLRAHCEAWGIEMEVYGTFLSELVEKGEAEWSELPPDIRLKLALHMGFEYGYMARVMREDQEREERTEERPTLCSCHFTGHRPGCPNA